MLPRLSYYVQQEAEEAFRKLVAKALSFVLIVATAVSIYFTLYAKGIHPASGGKRLPAGCRTDGDPDADGTFDWMSNITGIQIREHQYICLACHFTARRL